MGYLFRIILKYKNGFLTKKIRFFDKNFERLHLRNLLLNENHAPHNRRLHVSDTFKESEKPDIGTVKPDIETVKVDIEKNIIEPVYGHGKGKYRFKVNKG